MRERDVPPVYGAEQLVEQAAPMPAPARTVRRRRSPAERERAEFDRTIRRLSRMPVAVLPWVAILFGWFWWPALIPGAALVIRAWRWGHRGAVVAGVVLVAVAALHLLLTAPPSHIF